MPRYTAVHIFSKYIFTLINLYVHAINMIALICTIRSIQVGNNTHQEYCAYMSIFVFHFHSLSVPDLKLWRHEGGNSWWNPISATQHPRGSADPLVAQMAQFAAVVRREEQPLVSGAEGLATLAVVEAIQRSAETGETVVL